MGYQVDVARRTVRSAATSSFVVGLARLGYAIKGVVYVVIGLLAILLVTGHSGTLTDQNGALKAIYESPLGPGFGRFLMIIVMVGLFAFALWSLIQAVFDTEGKGRTPKGFFPAWATLVWPFPIPCSVSALCRLPRPAIPTLRPEIRRALLRTGLLFYSSNRRACCWLFWWACLSSV